MAAVAFGTAYGIGVYLTGSRLAARILDYPGERSLHDRPVPRLGGLAILAALLITVPYALWVYPPSAGLPALIVGVILLGAVSFWDDLRGLPVAVRLGAHLCAALLLLFWGFGLQDLHIPGIGLLPLGWGGNLITILFVLWFANLYNFMDGMDGFAGGIGVIGFSCLALLGWWSGHQLLAGLAILIAAGNLGFLMLNFPPARIFLGDVGSIPMGFLAAGFSLWGVRDGIFPLWVPVLVFSPFIADATITFFRRVFRGEKVWRAHRSHYYQRLVLLGWGHKKTVLAEYLLMAAAGGSALALHFGRDDGNTALGLLLWIAVYGAVALAIEYQERKRRLSR